MNLKDVLTQIDGLLKHSRIEYAVIGGYAVAASSAHRGAGLTSL